MIGNPRESLLALLGGRGEVEEEFRRTRLFPGEMDMLEDVASVAVRQKLSIAQTEELARLGPFRVEDLKSVLGGSSLPVDRSERARNQVGFADIDEDTRRIAKNDRIQRVRIYDHIPETIVVSPVADLKGR